MEKAALPNTPNIPIVTSIAPLTGRFDVWLTDIWGVMHNGVTPFLPAAAACEKFREQGGTVLLLSNAPRPADSVAAQLDRIGVPRAAWDSILTSGDAAHALVGALGSRRVFHLGPERDLGIYEGLAVSLSDAASAEAIACTGLFNDEVEGPDDYSTLLADLAARNLPMICANPDLTVERGNRIVFCAGSLAHAYATYGGEVAYAGKPHLPIYHQAYTRLATLRGAPVDPARILAIGDGIRTDIAGATAAGLASVFIASGVHAGQGLDQSTLATLFPDPAMRPIAAMTGLAW